MKTELLNVPGMKLPPMDATEAMRIIANVTSNMSPANPQVLNALRAETILFNIVAAARELLDVSPRNFAASEKLRKALAGAIVLTLLTGCAPSRPYLQCTVDDHLSYTVADVRAVRADTGMLRIVRKGRLANVYHNPLPGETCERVTTIDWTLTR